MQGAGVRVRVRGGGEAEQTVGLRALEVNLLGGLGGILDLVRVKVRVRVRVKIRG